MVTASVGPAVEHILSQQFDTAFSSLKWQLEGIGALAVRYRTASPIVIVTAPERFHRTKLAAAS